MDPLPSSSDPATEPGRPGSGITCRHVYDGSILTLWGEVDAQLREAASQAMASLASRPDPAPVVVDARDVTFIDSSGVAFILQVFVLGEETGSTVTLRDPSAEVMRVLDMVGISEHLLMEEKATA
ncbi:STAS domain-containing protein [Myceligenerans halotolerans]